MSLLPGTDSATTVRSTGCLVAFLPMVFNASSFSQHFIMVWDMFSKALGPEVHLQAMGSDVQGGLVARLSNQLCGIPLYSAVI